jgi:hypothetical protein
LTYRIAQLLYISLALTLSATTNAEERSFPTTFDWGSIVATDASVDLHVTSVPEDRVIRFPRFNNPYKRIVARNAAATTMFKFTPEVDEWLIAVPETVNVPSVIVIETVGAPQLLTRPVVNSPNKQGTFVLPAHHAVTHGKLLRYEPQPHKNTVGYWANENDWCEWIIDVDNSARYEVEVLQGCGKGHGGSEVAVSIGNRQLTFVVEDTGHFQNFKPRTIGTIEIDAPGRQSLKVVPISKAKGAVMDVRQIRLIPAK